MLIYLLIGFIVGVVFTFAIIISYTLRQMKNGGHPDDYGDY